MAERNRPTFQDVRPGEFFVLVSDSRLCGRVLYKQHDGRADMVGGIWGPSTQKVPISLAPFGRAIGPDEEVILLHPCTFEAK